MSHGEVSALPVKKCLMPTAHLYLWVPNARLPEGLQLLSAWGFNYKSNIILYEERESRGKDNCSGGF
jgi:N6-adenosine-specific RNA methylase IME4